MQFRDLGAQYQALKTEIDVAIQDVIKSTAFILGKPVTELENKLAEYVGRKHCISCANGTEALQLALMSWGIGSGDAVFTSDFTYFASASTASIVGATPVLVDIDLATFNISSEALENAIKRTIAETNDAINLFLSNLGFIYFRYKGQLNLCRKCTSQSFFTFCRNISMHEPGKSL